MTGTTVDDLMRRREAYQEVADRLRAEGPDMEHAANLVDMWAETIAPFRGATRWPFPTGSKPTRSEKC